MDLLQSVRKEGSRGGVNFSWDDVRSNPRRETYLGHSLMAPVGRWQKNKDLNWYAKADEAELTPEERAERERERKREEVRKIKEAEEDAMNRAMGLPVPDRTNANLEPLGVSQVDVNKALKEALDDGEVENAGKGVGFGSKTGATDKGKEVMKGSRGHDERHRDRSRSRERRRDRGGERGEGRRHRSRSQSGDRDRERRRRHRHRDRSRSREGGRRDRRSRSRHDEDGHRSRRRDYDERPRSRDRDRHERRRSQDKERRKHRSRSRSPHADSRRRRDD